MQFAVSALIDSPEHYLLFDLRKRWSFFFFNQVLEKILVPASRKFLFLRGKNWGSFELRPSYHSGWDCYFSVLIFGELLDVVSTSMFKWTCDFLSQYCFGKHSQMFLFNRWLVSCFWMTILIVFYSVANHYCFCCWLPFEK